MPVLIFKIKNYTNENVIENMVNYIAASPYIECVGMSGCFLYPGQELPEGISNAFNAVKNVYYKNDGQLIQHIIIGLEDIEKVTENDAAIIATRISDYFFVRGYQTFWGLHYGSGGNESYRHIHLVINTINGVTGLRYAPTYENMGDLKKFLEKLYTEYSWSYYTSESFYKEYE